MNYLDLALVLEARKRGRGVERCLVRHTHLCKRPLGIVAWQLGAEPFGPNAIAWGFERKDRSLEVAGDSRARQLLFRAMLEFAKAFNPWWENAGDDRQIVVLNRGTISLLGRLGRRLAYLPTDGPTPADPELVRLGRHLQFIGRHAMTHGQQLIVALTDLLNDHWAVDLSDVERQHLPALAAAVAPPAGKSVAEAVADAELRAIGPLPGEREDAPLDRLVKEFNSKRARSVDPEVVVPLLGPIQRHYDQLIRPGWSLLWQCLEREREQEEAESARDRWKEDLEAAAWHLQWVLGGRRYRTRDTNARAARTLRNWEVAASKLVARRAIDDPLEMLRCELAGDAVSGTVVEVVADHYERGPKRRVHRPLVTIETVIEPRVPVGSTVYWSQEPSTHVFEISEASRVADDRWRVVLMQTGGMRSGLLPKVNDRASFCKHSVTEDHVMKLPRSVPWTHARERAVDASIESPGTDPSGTWS